ncbi:MAG TPA: hypothetical protein VMV38_00150 [Candidatus Paceibacterota bacterium]|nr:hypothetical protein [Candidatus Paceibacterota bacterium]
MNTLTVLAVACMGVLFFIGVNVFFKSGEAFTRFARREAARKEFVIRRITDLFENGILKQIVIDSNENVHVYGISGYVRMTPYLDSVNISKQGKLSLNRVVVVALTGFSYEDVRYAAESLRRSEGFHNEPGTEGEFILSRVS